MWERREGAPIQSPAPMFLTLKGLYPLGSDQWTKSMSVKTKNAPSQKKGEEVISDYFDFLLFYNR